MIEMSFRHLRVFHAVARHASYTRAAEHLNISQPAISTQVQELEKAIGTQLFHRQGKRISLTDAGRRVYDYAQRILDLTDELEQALAELEDTTKGHLRLIASSTLGVYILPSFLALFAQRYPDVEVSLQVSNSQHVAASMLQREYHLGFVSLEMEVPGLQWRTLGTDELVIVAQPGHPCALSPITPDELCDETLLLREPGSGARRAFEVQLERLGQKPRRTLEVGSTEAIKRAVAAGLGLSAIPRRSLSADGAKEGLGLVMVDGMDLQRPLGILTPKGTRLAPSALAFTAALQKAAL